MGTFGLRELRQQASELVRKAENGEDVTITVAGRPSVRLVPVAPARWRRFDEIADLWSGPADPDWERDRDLTDQSLRDPWTT
ncbi:type II toxin-antitoxin system Phd/YefM family antitoxin [Nocardia sp. NPDC058176]|uniref:type II toxin-antitoxin system Phd/YefM family antitoxin n=1 Tax=Nocardia sp. NPDC058176 TaxID=3346368 RepID=UPI0036D818A8